MFNIAKRQGRETARRQEKRRIVIERRDVVDVERIG